MSAEDRTRSSEAPAASRGAEVADLTHVAELVVAGHGAAPCASVAAAVRRDGVWHFGRGVFGGLTWAPDAPRATLETPFDLASITKPFTALTLARLERRRLLHRSERLGDVLPELAGTRSGGVALNLLMAHRAGLDAHRKLYAPLLEGKTVDLHESLLVAADARREECTGEPPEGGFAPIYSDLGYLLVGQALAARAGDDLDRTVDREIVLPLGLDVGSARLLRERSASFDDAVAPTEVVPFRGGLVRGAVHDENAWAIAGDASAGHAGLFGDARSVARLGVALLEVLQGERSSWLDPADLEPILALRPGGSLLAGFDRKSGDAPSSGSRFGPRTFGHLGFTGTSLWIDPDRELVGVLLTNRVHPTRDAIAIRKARPEAYDAIAVAMGAVDR